MTRINSAWERFWFAPTSTSTLALVRIFFGGTCVLWTLSLFPDLELVSDDGLLPARLSSGDGVWTLWDLSGNRTTLVIGVLVMLIASVCLMVGFGTRVAALLVFVGLMSFQRRNGYAFAGGDLLLRTEAFYLLLAPAGAAL